AQARHGGPDLPWLSERTDLSDQDVLLVAKAKLHNQIGLLRPYGDVLLFLPVLRPRKQLPKALCSLSPDFLGFQHLSLAPRLSESAETIRSSETHCQDEIYPTGLDQGWTGLDGVFSRGSGRARGEATRPRPALLAGFTAEASRPPEARRDAE